MNAAARCVDFAVATTATAAGMQCTAKFDSSRCSGTSGGQVTVRSGENRRGFNTGDQVRFVEISCERAPDP